MPRCATATVSARMQPAAVMRGATSRTRAAATAGSRAVPCRPGRATAVRVSAFRDVHRAEQLASAAREFSNEWLAGIRSGASDKAMYELAQLVDPRVKLTSSHVLSCSSSEGLDGLRDRIVAEHQKHSPVETRCVMCAANDDDDSAFCLLEMKCKQEGSQELRSVYQLMRYDMLLDDTARRIMSMQQRGQFAQNDVPRLAAQQLGMGTQETPFPVSHIIEHPKGMDPQHMRKVSEAWCRARCSGQKEDILTDVLDKNFHLWDAYGVLPLLCDPQARSQDMGHACVVPYENVQGMIKNMKELYNLEVHMLDNAVSHTHNIGFTRWMLHATNKKDGNKFDVEGMEVDIYSPEGKLLDVWLFRDPMDFEKETLAAAAKQAVAGSAGSSATGSSHGTSSD